MVFINVVTSCNYLNPMVFLGGQATGVSDITGNRISSWRNRRIFISSVGRSLLNAPKNIYFLSIGYYNTLSFFVLLLGTPYSDREQRSKIRLEWKSSPSRWVPLMITMMLLGFCSAVHNASYWELGRCQLFWSIIQSGVVRLSSSWCLWWWSNAPCLWALGSRSPADLLNCWVHASV